MQADHELDAHELLVRELERERIRPVPPRPPVDRSHLVAVPTTPAERLRQLDTEVEEYESAHRSRAQLRVITRKEPA